MSAVTSQSSNTSRQAVSWKLWAAGLTFIFSIYTFFTSANAVDAGFPAIISALLFFSEAKLVPADLVVGLRQFFKFGDKYARLLLFVIAIGGTALVVKRSFGLDLLPDSVDFWIKRSGPPLIIVTVSAYLCFILSKLTFKASYVFKDLGVMRFEIMLYFSLCIFCLSSTLLLMGVNFMDTLFSHDPDKKASDIIWSPLWFHIFLCSTLVSLICSLCYGLCVLSRYFEWALRETDATLDVKKEIVPGARASIYSDEISATADLIV